MSAPVIEPQDKPRCVEFARGRDGRFLPRYLGITPPKLDPTFDKDARETFVKAIVDTLPEGELRPVAEAAYPTGFLFNEFLRRFEQLCWWGLKRKDPWVELIAGYAPVSGCITTPEGSWVIGSIGWKVRAAPVSE